MENNEIKDIEKNVDEVVEETITEEAINEEVIEEANEIIEAVEEEKDVKKVKAALEALKAKLANAGSAVKVKVANAGSAVKVKVAGAGSAIKGKGKIVVTTISGKMVNAKDAVKNSKFGKAVGNGTTKVVVYVKGHKKGVIAIASGAALVAALGIGGCAAHKHFSNKPAVETTATPTPTVAPTATPVPTATPTVAPTATPVPTQAPVVSEVKNAISAVADEKLAELEAKGFAADKAEVEAAVTYIRIESLGEDVNEIAEGVNDRIALFDLNSNLLGRIADNNIVASGNIDKYISLVDFSDNEMDKAILSALDNMYISFINDLHTGKMNEENYKNYVNSYMRFFKRMTKDDQPKYDDLTLGGKMVAEMVNGYQMYLMFVVNEAYATDEMLDELDVIKRDINNGSRYMGVIAYPEDRPECSLIKK